ncbi:aminotransferase class I/II-fold pyridoxal phosphate-dependent enzyme [Pelagibacteraceae bacterium]|nr:aminotransferase class I/II-fold pyridoxal phosphate-dependent enzyme [Pelagibacteraceae bacterium]
MKIAKSVSRLGTEAVYNIFSETKKLINQGKKIIDLSLGQSDFKSPNHVVEATIQALKDGYHGYTLPNGIIECREAVSRKIKNLYKANISSERIIIMPGGKPTMYYAISFFGEPGGEIIYPDPGFPIYESMISYTGAKAIPYNLTKKKDFSIDIDSILSLINEKTRLLIINNPHNPTGNFIEKKTIDKLAKSLINFPHVAILSDEIYDRLIFDKKEIPTFFNYPDLYDRLIVLNGWSKTYAMTGWRLGWGVWPENLIEHVFKFCVNNHSCVNAAAQYGAIAALDGPEDHLSNMMKEFTIRRKLIVDGVKSLKGVDCILPGGTFFVFPNVRETGMNGEEFTEKCLKEAGVAAIPGKAFGKFATHNVRFNFATSRENISKAIEKIDKILK